MQYSRYFKELSPNLFCPEKPGPLGQDSLFLFVCQVSGVSALAPLFIIPDPWNRHLTPATRHLPPDPCHL